MASRGSPRRQLLHKKLDSFCDRVEYRDVDALERFLDTAPERQAPTSILPMDELEERLALVNRLEKFWYDEFTSLTKKPDRTEYKPFNNLQIAALMVMNIDDLRDYARLAEDSIITGLCNIPYLAKIFLARKPSEDDTQFSKFFRPPSLEMYSKDDQSSQSDKVEVKNGKAERSKNQSKKRLVLDGNRCTILGTADPEVCHIVPYSANCKEDKRLDFYNKLYGTKSLLYGEARNAEIRRYFTSSVGISDKKWNMISLNHQLHQWWGKFYFGLECLGTTHLPGKPEGVVTLRLQFHWMPRNNRPRQRLPDNPEDFVNVFDNTIGSPLVPDPLVAAAQPASGWTVQTGDIFYIDIDAKYVEKMKAAFDLQWALIRIIAIAGGAKALELVGDEPDYLVGGQLQGLVAMRQAFLVFDATVETSQEASSVSSIAEEPLIEDLQDDRSREKALAIRVDKQTDNKQADKEQADKEQADDQQADDEQADDEQDDDDNRNADDSDKDKLEPHSQERP